MKNPVATIMPTIEMYNKQKSLHLPPCQEISQENSIRQVVDLLGNVNSFLRNFLSISLSRFGESTVILSNLCVLQKILCQH